MGRVGKAALLVAVGIAGGGAAFALASVPDSNGVIHACVITDDSGFPVNTANLRVIDPGSGQKCDTTANPTGPPATEENLTWNQAGPRGATGQQGPSGRVITIASGHTLTIGGRVVTVGGSPGLTIKPPSGGGGKPIGTLTLDTGSGTPLTFEIQSFSFGAGATSAGGGGGGGTGKTAVHEIEITKWFDKASPRLAKYCIHGVHIKEAILTMRKAGGTGGQLQVYLEYKLNNVLVSGFQTSSGGDRPTESLSLNFTKLAVKYP
jgi:type VI secretion system secreted protein Hcp